MNRTARLSLVLAICSVLGGSGLAAAQAEQRDRLQRTLENPVSVVFEQIHLSEVCDFITQAYEVNIVLDSRVVAPREGKVATAAAPAEYTTDGMVAYVNLRNVPLNDALHAILKPLGLTYEVLPHFVWISTPANIRHETFENLETREYDLPNPKLSNVNADRPDATTGQIDLVELLGHVIPENVDPATNKPLSYIRFNEETKKLVVHTSPMNHSKIKAILDALLPTN